MIDPLLNLCCCARQKFIVIMGCSNSSVNALLHQHSCQLKGFLHCLWSIINTRQDMQMRIDHILLPCKGPAATGNLSASIIHSQTHIFLQGLCECRYLLFAGQQPARFTYHHCTRWQCHLQVQHPLSTCLPLKQVLVMPTLCILRGRTRYRPYKGNCVDLTMGECEKASPHLMAEGFIRAARLPPILPL